ncbi:hypothetical protein [uncultured Roseobacter sp.]|uniref:hypothetical protein n=1 Tax=uncultured Roseobacter sp. TaxID=114847 RepID=UPI00263A108F|nr:hypothetical protein [uncultured Roseobacter sp.]
MAEPDSKKDERAGKVFVACDSPNSAARATGGQVYSVKGINFATNKRGVSEKNAFILTMQDKKNLLYVRVSYKAYAKLVDDAAGENVFERFGNHRDHVASAENNKSKLDKNDDLYVLMSEIPASVNQSAGSEEKTSQIDFAFFRSSRGQLPDGGLAVPAMPRELRKSQGKMKSETADLCDTDPLANDKIAKAWLQDPKYQENLETMKHRLICDGQSMEIPTYRPQKIEGEFAWDRHKIKKQVSAKNDRTERDTERKMKK